MGVRGVAGQRELVISIRNMSTGYKLCQRQNDKKPLKGANNTLLAARVVGWLAGRRRAAGTMTNRSTNRKRSKSKRATVATTATQIATTTETTKGHTTCAISVYVCVPGAVFAFAKSFAAVGAAWGWRLGPAVLPSRLDGH